MARVWRNPEFEERLVLFRPNTTLGWGVARSISRDEGERGVRSGRFRHVLDDVSGQLIGFQIVPAAEQRGDKDRVSVVSTAALSAREMEANAGAYGRSKTASMPEWQRECRRHPDTGALLPMEDFVERTKAKVAVFPLVGPRKGDIVRAWDAAEKAGLL